MRLCPCLVGAIATYNPLSSTVCQPGGPSSPSGEQAVCGTMMGMAEQGLAHMCGALERSHSPQPCIWPSFEGREPCNCLRLFTWGMLKGPAAGTSEQVRLLSSIRLSTTQPDHSPETVLATGTLLCLHPETEQCGLQLGCSLPGPLKSSFSVSLTPRGVVRVPVGLR